MNLQAETVKAAAAGRWEEILTQLGGCNPELLDERNHPCPRCGGKDRFRLIDVEAGALFCNQCCNSKNGDGIAALMWLKGWTFPKALEELGRFLGLTASSNPSNGRSKDTKSRVI